MAAGLGGEGSSPDRSGCREDQVLHVGAVSLSVGRRDAHGTRAGVFHRGCDRPVQTDERLPGASPDGRGRLRLAGGERGHQAGGKPPGLDPQQHEKVPGGAGAARDFLRLGPLRGHLPARLLPVHPVAVSPFLRAGFGLPEEGAGQLVPRLRRPFWPTNRWKTAGAGGATRR